MSERVTFEAWAVELPDFELPFVHATGARSIPWFTQSSEEAAGEALTQRTLGVMGAKLVRVRVTVEVVEPAE